MRMEPLVPEHKEEIRGAIDCDAGTWSIMLADPVGAGFEDYWSASCGAPLTEHMPYAIRRLSDSPVVGMSSYFTASAKQGGVEIGAVSCVPMCVRAPSTRIGNPAAGHAFEAGAVRVQFKVDSRNECSQAAVAKLAQSGRECCGATCEHGPDISVIPSYSRYLIVSGRR